MHLQGRYFLCLPKEEKINDQVVSEECHVSFVLVRSKIQQLLGYLFTNPYSTVVQDKYRSYKEVFRAQAGTH
jgi:hypothetical protein